MMRAGGRLEPKGRDVPGGGRREEEPDMAPGRAEAPGRLPLSQVRLFTGSERTVERRNGVNGSPGRRLALLDHLS